MFIDFVFIIIQIITATITLASVILIYRTIKSNKDLNQKILFSNITKEERELRVKFNEYRDEIQKRIKRKVKQDDWVEITFDYDTLLFNYYEYVAICIYQELIEESDARMYFRTLLISVKDKFENSLLFEEGLAKKEEYPGIQ